MFMEETSLDVSSISMVDFPGKRRSRLSLKWHKECLPDEGEGGKEVQQHAASSLTWEDHMMSPNSPSPHSAAGWPWNLRWITFPPATSSVSCSL